MLTRRDKVDFFVAWGGFIIVMVFLITMTIVGYLGTPDPIPETTLDPENYTDFTDASEETSQGMVLLTPTDTPSVINYRLPESLKPLHYLVKLQPFVNGNYTILGYMEVEMRVVNSTSSIVLHMADIITHNDTITVVQDGVQVVVKEHVYDTEREWYVAQLDQELQVDQTVNISLWFTGLLNDQLRGFYRSSYVDPDGNTVKLAASFFAPTDARRAFPCMDEPALKAKFSVSLAREENMKSLSNMPRYSSEPVLGQPGWVWDHFTTSVPMSTYLVAFVVSDFVYNSTYVDGVELSVWTRPSLVGQAGVALESGRKALTFLEEYFTLRYPLAKQDLVALPDSAASAMENWGLITFSEPSMLYNPGVSSASNRQRVVVLVSHELAHQWFGNLVTPSWWNDIWLNEGFATFLQSVVTDYLEPEWKMVEQMVVDGVQMVMVLDSLCSSHPISINVDTLDQIHQIYDTIAYVKGSSIIRMMSHFLTETTFRRGLASYLNYYAYNSATQDDLWQFLTAAAHQDGTLTSDLTVKVIMDTWTLQMGYPLITVTRSDDGTSATVTQERFLLIPRENTTARQQEAPYRWWVPLSYTSANNSDFSNTIPSEWMKDSEEHKALTSLPASDQWVIFNLQETGYYRVNYDSNNWALITDQLKTDHEAIHVINRAQIIDDALNLARAGRLSYETALRLNVYLRKEQEYTPWQAALTSLTYLQDMLSRTPSYLALKKYLLDLLMPLYKSVGFEDAEDDPHFQQYKRVLALSWACRLGLPDCVKNADSHFKAWLNGSSISPNLKSTVYCTGIAQGGEVEWEAAWSRYLTSNTPAEKTQLLAALGCTKHTGILSRYLDMAFTEGSGIRKADSILVLNAVAENDVGHSLAWHYLTRRWQYITSYYDTFTSLTSLLVVATSKFNTPRELQQLEAFRKENSNTLRPASYALQQALESTNHNIAWINNNYDVIVRWLHDNGYKEVY